MPEMISPANQEVIARELAACDVSSEDIQWAISKLDRAAARFSRTTQKGGMKKRSPKTLTKQINKVENLTGKARAQAIKDAEEMGLDSEALNLLGTDKQVQSLREYAHNLEVLDRLNPEHFSPLANKDFREARTLMFWCIGVWSVTAGLVRFSNNDREDCGPMGRFLTAASTDAYIARGHEVPSPNALRLKAKRLDSALGAAAFVWNDFFEMLEREDMADDELDPFEDLFYP
ncbi:hypothetical protein M3N55_15370 [Roseibaca sp. V10]|uniref:Uncharacterized protein n=1 Tax=Roseinatronobacter domitianus TaxID=2940293 RepID=A0ABT0M5G8_9RHOB|nr:hypothetical protein [Roseibaca domitiana]MCL1630105.1 hypothetical protein [Roseibaca domitiana]